MKNIYAVVLGMVFSVQVQAFELPNCFKTGVATGRYIIGADLEKISKESLVQLLSDANGKSIMPARYPIFGLKPTLFLIVGMRPLLNGGWPARELVESEVRNLVTIQGVTSVECDLIVGPWPRIGGGN
jgi:hypothetical protein